MEIEKHLIIAIYLVGGGSAGAIVASRLSEKHRVLLLEAGGDPSPLFNFPYLFGMRPDDPLMDWQYKSCQTTANSSGILEENCQKLPRGKCLGGSSSINALMYIRGSPEDYNNWAAHTGDNRWLYENVKRLFRKLEDYNGQWKENGLHGVGGPIHIESNKFAPTLSYWLEAGKELGFEVNDPNGYQTEGFYPIDWNQKKGMRVSTYKGYIEPALKRENLIIHRFSLATKIHFDVNMRAVGVEYLRHGVPRYAQATKEIVVSGGAINSPQLLMLSGIGPRQHLTHHQIPTLVDLPVGQNFQDHIISFAGPVVFDKPVSHIPSRDVTWGSVRDYVEDGTGPFSSSAVVIGNAFLASSQSPKNWPDLCIYVNANAPSAALGRGCDQLWSYDVFENHYGREEGKDGNIPIVSVGRPKSRGQILLRDSNPLSHPLINPFQKYGQHPDDLRRLIEGLNYTVQIFEGTSVYAKLGARLSSHHLPGCEQFELKSYSYWECYAKLTSRLSFHHTSTCSMGKPGDPNAVVDSQLRVLGTSGLRVADTSIMPFIVNANTNAPAMMIGEMCSEMILQDWP